MGIKTKKRINDLLVHFEVDLDDLTEKEILLMILDKLEGIDRQNDLRTKTVIMILEKLEGIEEKSNKN